MNSPLGPKDAVYCTRCGFTGKHDITSEITGGQWASLLVLLLLFVIPGIIYGIHLATGGGGQRVRVCPQCNAKRMWVPLDSPAAAARRPPVLCRNCGKFSESSAKFCPDCGGAFQSNAAQHGA